MANKTRLDTTMETDFLQSFVRGNLAALENESNAEKSKKLGEPLRSPKADSSEIVPLELATAKPIKNVKIASPTSQICSKFLAETAKQKLANSKAKRRTIKSEELYTDKDRAAAVNMGTRDIKQSLKLKQAQDRSKVLHIPEHADPAQFFALGFYEMRRNEINIALGCMDKAIELNPRDKHALVARSKCYILLGQPQNGLRDAETALSIDKKFLKGIYQKAEALYYLGDFEHSLMHFHRGLHIRPDHEGFKLGVEKAQKAIETALGVRMVVQSTKSRSKSATPSSLSKINDDNNNLSTDKVSHQTSTTATSKNQRSRSSRRQAPKCKLLKELTADKEYLESLLQNSDLQFAKTKETVQVLQYVQETVNYLNNHEEFWRQQMPVHH